MNQIATAAVLYVKDLMRMRTFYESCFGMAAVESADDFCVLESDGWELSLVVMPEAIAISVTLTDPPTRRENSAIKLAVDVANIEALQGAITGAGGHSDPIESAWTFRGRRHVDCLDPEGNVVQLRDVAQL